MNGKSEIRNPKSETNFKYLKFKIFGFVSCFVLVISCFVVLSFAPHALAQGFIPLAPIPGLTENATADTAGLANFFNNLYKYAIGIAAILAVIIITWSGIRIAMNQDNVSSITESKGRIVQALFGLVLVLSPVLVFSIINPSILNLSLNLPPLETKSGPPATAPAPKPVLDTNSQLYPCAPDTCAAVRTACRTSAFTTDVGSYYKVSSDVVCVRSDGTIDSKGRTDSWLNSSFGCIAGESLNVNCTISKTTTP